MTDLATTLQQTTHQLDALRLRVKRAVWIDAFGLAGLRLLGFALLSYLADRVFELEQPIRAVLLLGLVGLILDAIRRRALRHRIDRLPQDELALAFERGVGLEERLISAVQFARHDRGPGSAGVSQPMIDALLAEAEREAHRLSSAHAVEPVIERRGLRRILLVLAVFVTASAVFPDESARWGRRNLLLSTTPWPRATRLEFVDVPDGGYRVGPGQDLRLTIQVEGEIPDLVSVSTETRSGRETEQIASQVRDGRFRTLLENLRESVFVKATGGDGESQELRIEVVERPRLLDVDWTAELPDYLLGSSGSADTEADGPRTGEQLEVVRGGRALLSVRTDKPLRRLELRRTSSREAVEDVRDRVDATVSGQTGSLQFVPQIDGEFELHVEDIDGIDFDTAPRLAVRVLEDAPPAIDLTAFGIGTMVTVQARIPLRLVATDDHGLHHLSATARRQPADDTTATPAADLVAPEGASIVPDLSDFVPGVREIDRELAFDLQTLASGTVEVGDRLRLFVEAVDARRDEAGTGRSEPLVFRVVARELLLEDLGRRQGDVRRDVEETLLDTVDWIAELRGIESVTDAGSAASRTRGLGERLGRAAEVFGSVLDEFENNRLLEPRDLDRLRAAVVSALRGTVDGPITRATRALDVPTDRVSAIDELERAADEIRRVLNQLDRAEGLPRLVELVKGLLETTGRVESAVDAARSSQAVDDIFGPAGATESESGGRDRDD